ncbi:tetratricopeptide repeat protein, partial [Nostoc sp. CHAB 5715]|uniref:TPR end-of-group domain-containing protein n=1 Tax=Nostoc sp. CHAB 5715 TaxID=2780400 RepID=UPI001E450FA2
PDLHEAWYNRGNALGKLERNEEAIASYDQALKFKPDLHEAWYGKACCYALQGNIEQALENLQKAINLSPDEWREWAKTDSDFDGIREDERFKALIQ